MKLNTATDMGGALLVRNSPTGKILSGTTGSSAIFEGLNTIRENIASGATLSIGNFTGNSDQDTKVYSMFTKIEARYVRIVPTEYNTYISGNAAIRSGYAAIRVDLLFDPIIIFIFIIFIFH